MAVIHVLDKHTAELIAAGEVVERPASVVKELLENSIDAGATQVTVNIESGGVKLIEISDNGTGIDAEYIPTAFIRHATSKIEKPDDLNSIHTLGFRGEALASIASVARVELLTRTEVDEFATCYRIAGGEEQGREPAARAVGTTIRVQDLFYNTPARMKFLKKDSSEGTFVADNVGHVALSHPEVSVKFIREGKLQYVTPGDGQLRSAAYAVLGKRQTARTGSLVVTCGSFLWGGLELGALLLLGRTEVGSALFGQLGLTMFQDVPFLQGLTGQTLPYFLFIGIVNTALGYVFHMLAIEKTSAIHGSLVFFFKPILAPLFALAVLGEAVTPPILLGIVCFLAGSLVSILPDILRARRAGQGRLAGEAAPQHEGKGR